jgi:hypothetical protein
VTEALIGILSLVLFPISVYPTHGTSSYRQQVDKNSEKEVLILWVVVREEGKNRCVRQDKSRSSHLPMASNANLLRINIQV